MEVYVIHSPSLFKKAVKHGQELEKDGNFVYISGRNTKVYDADEGKFLPELDIFRQKKDAISKAKEVHVFSDGEDHNYSIELGMALMANKPITFVHAGVRPVDRLMKELREKIKNEEK
jgi:hypothetical protein